MIDLSKLTFWELNKLYAQLGFEMLSRYWYVVVSIGVLVIAGWFIFDMIKEERNGKG